MTPAEWHEKWCSEWDAATERMHMLLAETEVEVTLHRLQTIYGCKHLCMGFWIEGHNSHPAVIKARLLSEPAEMLADRELVEWPEDHLDEELAQETRIR